MKWRGQYLQDKYVYTTFFPGVTTGVFLDVGASDGCRFSNTMALEELGWTGVLVEPRPAAAAAAVACRSSPVENVAIAAVEGTASFLDIEGYGEGLSGIVSEYDPRHVSRITQELQNPDCRGASKITVNTVPLQKLLDKHCLRVINYMSLDVEGSELVVLQSIDWKKTLIEVIDVEVNYGDGAIVDYLSQLGYIVHSTVGCDYIFILGCNNVTSNK